MGTITISRQFGAGGITLGNLLAQRLGYQFYDKHILQLIAKETCVSTRWVEYLDNQLGSKFQKIISSAFAKGKIEIISNTDEKPIDEKIYLDRLYKTITSIADKGNAVIVGRASQYILKDRPNVVQLLLVADKPDRINYLMKTYGISYQQATRTLTYQDQKRSGLYQLLNKPDYDQPDLYHLVVNMSKVTMEKACDLVCDFVRFQL
jgi:cytidylate kinase